MTKEVEAWLQETINKLESFKQKVEDGQVIVKDGDYSVTRPVPDREQATYDYISLSIDYVEIKTQTKGK